MNFNNIKDIINYLSNLSVEEKNRLLNHERTVFKNIVDKTDDISLIFKLFEIVNISDVLNHNYYIFNEKFESIFSNHKSHFYNYIFDGNYPIIINNVFQIY